MAQKHTKEELLTIDLIYSVIQPSRSTCYDHIEEAEIQEQRDYHCDDCHNYMYDWHSRGKKSGLCPECFEAFMM